jgi:hypothetical protein
MLGLRMGEVFDKKCLFSENRCNNNNNNSNINYEALSNKQNLDCKSGTQNGGIFQSTYQKLNNTQTDLKIES